MYNYSDNFGVPNGSRQTYPDGGPPDNTEGIGYDYGLGFSFFNNRISGRLTRFEADSANLAAFAYNLTNINNELLEALVNASAITQAEANARRVIGTGYTYDQHVEGYEFSVTANITRNWRLSASYAFTDGFQSNTYPDQIAYRDGKLGDFGGLTYFANPAWANIMIENGTFNGPTIAQYISEYKTELAADLLIDGVALAGNRPHKANLFTRYSFSDGMLKGLFIGGGAKYVSGLDLGFGTDSTGAPVQLLSEGYTEFNGLVGYDCGSVLGLRNLTFQLNISNLLNDQDYIVTSQTVNKDVLRVVYLQPRTFRLSASIRF
jgi:outer membrane receptor for monomeric catechols